MKTNRHKIRIRGARQHNLKDINLDIPRDALTIITGLSGSGKSSLAFDTLYAEGQRRYVESLSTHARQFLEQMPKPDVDQIEGLPPTVAIEQRSGSTNPRSTVATTTEIYDYLRALYARVGTPICWKCKQPVSRCSVSQIVDTLFTDSRDRTVLILAPVLSGQRGKGQDVLERLRKEGLVRIRLNNQILRLEDVTELPKHKGNYLQAVVDRLTLRDGVQSRLAESIELALMLGNGLVMVSENTAATSNGSTSQDSPPQISSPSSNGANSTSRMNGENGSSWVDRLFTSELVCTRHLEIRFPELSPRLFSFNSPLGACPACNGLGTVLEFDEELLVSDDHRSLTQGAIDAWRHGNKKVHTLYHQMLDEFCSRFEVHPDAPWRNLPQDRRRILIHGTTATDEQRFGASFEGVIPFLKHRWEKTESETVKQKLHAYMSESPCPDCEGSRLRTEARSVQIGGQSIDHVVRMDLVSARKWFNSLTWSGESAAISEPLIRAIRTRLQFMEEVGVGYLTLARSSVTLSGGEAQRVRLATQVGSGLVGVCYVLDEPTIGLHPRDSHRLVRTLQHLRDLGNTLIVVEHDEATIKAADHLVDMGPGAGEHGGRIIAQGSLTDIVRCEESLTGQYLSGRREIPIPDRPRTTDSVRTLEIRGACENNLKNIDVRIPLGCFVCVTGVSGSGKSTLVNQILVRALKRKLYSSREKPGRFDRLIGSQFIDQVIEIDQSPIGRTPRSNPATYVGVFDLIRQLYAKTREAKIRGYPPGRFSFNIKGGRCEQCQGQGIKRIEMHFLPDMYVNCDACKGTRYNRETLEIRYRGKNIAEVLDLRVDEARRFFDPFPKIKQRLQSLTDVGLGYLTLGQASTTLSGGEAQRVKLAAELGKSASQHTLYVLDEPTTGLHFADIQTLLRVLDRLVDQHHTVLVIEHNPDVIKVADWVIDLGPEGGNAGGRIIAEGPPNTIAKSPKSHTGQYLRSRLKIKHKNRHRKNLVRQVS